MKAFFNALTNLNPQQRALIYTSLFGTTGPIVWLLTKKLGLTDADAQMWLNFLAMFTPILAGIVLPTFASNRAQVDAIRTMTPEDKATAFSQVAPETRVQAAASVAGTTVVVDPATAPLSAIAAAHDPDQPNVVSTGASK